MPNRPLSLAVLGATGLVGRAVLEALPDAGLELGQLRLLASPRSAGTRLEVGDDELVVKVPEAGSFRGCDLAVFCAPPDVAREWAPRAWAEGWWAMPGTTGDLLCEILDAERGSIVMHQNVSVVESLLASCFDYRPPRNVIVYESLNFPTVMYVWEARRREGAQIREVASPDGMTVPTEAMVAAIDERTLLVPISHVLYKSSWLQDAKAIVARAHAAGARVILDCYQSAGTVPFSLKELDVDFACGGSVKWLCGGPGAGWLYVRPDLREQFEPKVTGWMAHAAPFDFASGPITYAKSSYRYLHGSPAIPALSRAGG